MMRDILTTIGGAYNEELNKFPEERTKFVIIGLFVCNTAFLSFLTMNFALHSLYPNKSDFDTWMLIMLVGAVWGFMIFTIDWGLIKTMVKEPYTTWRRYLQVVIIPTALRMLIAGLISFTISKPFEVRVAGNKLLPEIQKNKAEYLRKEKEIIDKNIKLKRDEITKKAEEKEKYANELSQGPSGKAYDEAKTDLSKAENEVKEIETIIATNRKNRNTFGVGWYYETKTNSEGNEYKVYRRTTRGVALDNEYKENLKPKFEALTKIKTKKDSLKTSIFTDFKKNKDSQITLTDSSISNQNTLLQGLQKETLAAYDTLQKKADIAYDDNSLLNQIEALETLSDRDNSGSIFWVKWLIFLVILTVDLMPIFIKLLADYGNYDKRMAELKIEKETENRQRRFMVREEYKTNKGLIQKMAKSQRNIINESLKNWETEEKNKLKRPKDDDLFS